MSTTPRIGSYATQVYPPAALTSNTTTLTGQAYANGTYIVSASSVISVNYPYLAFDKSTVGGSFWGSTDVYNASGVYTGSVSTVDINSVSYPGEWLQIQLPYAIILQSYSFTGYVTSPNYAPGTFYILGSKEGDIIRRAEVQEIKRVYWTLLDSQVNTANTASYSITPTNSYKYFRIVSKTIATAKTAVTIAEWNLNGTQTSLTIGTDGQLGIGVTNPVQALEVAGNASINGTITTGNACSLRYWTITGTTPSAVSTTSSSYALPAGLTPSAIVVLWGVFSWAPNCYMAINNSYSTYTPDVNANTY